MDVKGALFALADLLMIFAGFTYGWKFIRNYKNYLLGLEWIIVATSGVNFLIYGMLRLSQDSTSFHVAIFFDAFSRSVGITLILVLGLMAVTHGYKPSRAVDIGVFALAGVVGLGLTFYALRTASPRRTTSRLAGAVFLVAMNVLTSVFLLYFAGRLWRVGEQATAAAVVVVTAMGAVITSDVRLLSGTRRRREPDDVLHRGPDHLGAPADRLLLRLPRIEQSHSECRPSAARSTNRLKRGGIGLTMG